MFRREQDVSQSKYFGSDEGYWGALACINVDCAVMELYGPKITQIHRSSISIR